MALERPELVGDGWQLDARFDDLLCQDIIDFLSAEVGFEALQNLCDLPAYD